MTLGLVNKELVECSRIIAFVARFTMGEILAEAEVEVRTEIEGLVTEYALNRSPAAR